MRLQIIAPLLSIDGYGYSAQNLAIALMDKGVDVKYCPHDWLESEFTPKEIKNIIIKKEDLDPDVPTIIFHLPPTADQYDLKHKIIFTMFETTKYPRGWLYWLDKASYVLTPCNFCKRSLNVRSLVAPLGISPVYKYKKRKKTKPFKFLIAGKLDNRKNYKAVVEAFLDEFNRDEKVELILKTRSEPKLDIIDHRQIRLIQEDYSVSQMYDLYLEAHCFVFPSRGEGFGLPPREALATGLPTILTDFSGLEDIAHLGHKVDYKLIKAEYPETSIHMKEDVGEWAEVNKESLKKQMRSVYNNYDKALEKAKKASKEDFSSAKGAEVIIDLLS